MTTIPASSRTTKITLASATAGPFDIDFRVVAADSLRVWVNDVERFDWAMSPGVISDYSDSATITFTSALSSGDVVDIAGDFPIGRGSNYLVGDPGLVRKLNLELAHLWTVGQELARDVGRALKLPLGVTSQASFRARDILTVNASRTDFVGKSPAEILATVGGALGNDSNVFPTVDEMLYSGGLSVGAVVGTLGYYEQLDGGGAFYVIKTNDEYGATPDGLIDHQVPGTSMVAELQHNREFNAQACGVREGVESSTAWNNAFWRAASLAPTTPDEAVAPVKFVCTIPVLTNKTLHMSRKPANEFVSGARVIMDVYHPGSITAVGGGTFESHLNNEMARLTTLHGSTVALGSALAAQFLKADPQLPVFLGDKIERPLPLIAMGITRGTVELKQVSPNYWCSGIRMNQCQITKFVPGLMLFGFRKYGILYTKNLNNAVKTNDVTVKQWAQGDLTSHGGRMMPGGYGEPRNFTGDCIVSCQKDMMWFAGNTGWSRAAVVTLDLCGTAESDRWAGRNMYPDYFTRWNDSVWADHGGSINQPQWDHMAPSVGTGDNDFYSMHVMQGTADDADGDEQFRMDGLDFGGQTGWENWNTTNPVNVYGADIDSSITQLFGSGIRFYQPTITVGNTAKHGCMHPVVRCYPARSINLINTEFENWGGSIGVMPFDRGVVGAPNVVSYSGSYTSWNARNRVDSGSYTGAVQYRGTISGGTGNLPSSSVTTVGDFFWVTEAGTYGGQAMAKGDILYALTLTPGTSYGANWYLGANNNVTALGSSKTVGLSKTLNTMVARSSDEPVLWITKPAGHWIQRMEVGLTKAEIDFDGTDVVMTTPGKIAVKNWNFQNGGDYEPANNGTQAFGSNTARVSNAFVTRLNLKGITTTGINIAGGSGSPEGVVTAGKGSLYLRDDGGAGTSFYVKESGSGSTGWVAK